MDQEPAAKRGRVDCEDDAISGLTAPGIAELTACSAGRTPPAPGDPARYFDLGFDPRAHACLLRHLNGIAVVCLAPNHPVLFKNLGVRTVTFTGDLAINATSGKKKRGALSVHPGMVLCTLECTNGERYIARCGAKGILVGVNKCLIDRPKLVSIDPLGTGHLAVIQLKANGGKNLVSSLEEYREKSQGGGLQEYGSRVAGDIGGVNVASSPPSAKGE